MNTHSKIVVIISIIGLLAIVAWRFIEPVLQENRLASVSDIAPNGTINIGVDGWVGYFPLCSPEMNRNLRRDGYGLNCVDDAADYDDRFEKLKRGEYQFAVATVDSYLLNGEKHNFPGPIISVIDESKGGDAIVARKSVVPNLEALKTIANGRVSLTLDSPSHHLAKAVSTHFDIPLFRNSRNISAANGSEEALKQLDAGSVDMAVLWEPEVSKAMANDEYVRLLGTEDTQQLIVDILIGSQDSIRNEPEMVHTLLKAYFSTLKHYRDDTSEFVSDIADHYDIRKSTAEQLLDGVHWATLSENAERWYGVDARSFSEDALVRSIESAAEILVEHGDFSKSPVPGRDPYRLINSTFIKDSSDRFVNAGGFTTATGGNQKVQLPALTPEQWDTLQEVGSLKNREISFSSGTSVLSLADKEQIDSLINDLVHYPNFRVEVRGHTGLRGDSDANLALSQERADAVVRYVDIAHELAPNRIRAIGFGGTRPLEKRPGESNRAYSYRLPRVEIALVREVL